VNTTIDLGTVDPKNLAQAAKMISIIYTMNGGLYGKKIYSFAEDDLTTTKDGKLITISKLINLQ
jgi:hypothetical protein